tara:strand:- start:230 stop:1159 length:930 start_codon:yes stop_codon:yes gene_type:complete
MQEEQNNKHFNDEIDLRDLFHVLSKGKRTIIYVTALISTLAIILSLLTPNIYESRTLLAPVKPANSISGALKSYSGLAGIAGISLPTDDEENNSAKALEKLKSLSFFENNILNNIFLPDLMAVKSWDYETNTLNYDSSIYEAKSKTWVRDYSYPQKLIPSAQESFEVFIENHLTLTEDIETGFISLSIKHQSPFIAKQWAELAVNQVDNFYRQKDKLESEKAVEYLSEQILMTSLSEIKQVIAELLQEETQKLSLVEANEYYVFEYIDPPAVMEEKYGPNRVLYFIVSLLLGALLGIFLVIIKHYFFKK